MGNKQQSSEFIIGYVFSQINKDTVTMARNLDLDSISTEYRVPKVWFGLRCSSSPLVRLHFGEERDYHSKLISVFKEMSPKSFSLNLNINPTEQYICFSYKIYRKKKMTIAQIEAELGYEVEVVKE